MLVIDQHKWASALDDYGLIKHGKHRGGAVLTEQSLRYKIKDDREFLDLTDYNIHGHLKLKNFNNLGELNCSSERKLNTLTKDYNDHTRNNITSLDLSECSGLIKLDCSSNIELTELNIGDCSNLESINVIGCLGLSKVICDNTPHSPEEIIEQAKKSYCLKYNCREVTYYNGYCNMHQRHYCKEEGCNSQIYISKEYCSNHSSICKISGCSFRAPLNSECAYHERVRQLREQKVIKENFLNRLISSVKSELHSKSIFSAKRSKREETYQNYLDSLLDAQKQSDQQVSLQIQLGKKGKECLIKKLGDKKIQNLCQTQMELTNLEKYLVELEEEISIILSLNSEPTVTGYVL
ncbi:39597_t:CDS:1 [Gigaspora margarita]|uniref:39597_t:CDS:1 n=1 Tax=Gigaspora margarita TaxID=4874 RepID=A0ABN7WDD5_GIGMA|nr:39597_t:CDS:1 [Gigaspora margarita]